MQSSLSHMHVALPFSLGLFLFDVGLVRLGGDLASVVVYRESVV